MVAQMNSSSLESHWRRIRIGRADPKVGRSPIESMDFSLWPTFFCDPIMSGSSVCRKFLQLGLGDNGGQRCGPRTGDLCGYLLGKWCITAADRSVLRECWLLCKKGGQMGLDGFSGLDRKTRRKRIRIRIGMD